MTSSPDTYTPAPGFGAPPAADRPPRIAPARLDAVLRGNELLGDLEADARLVDPRLARLVEQAAEKAREQAAAEGFALGYREGRAAVDREVQTEIARIRLEAEDSVRQRLDDLHAAASALAAAAADLERAAVPVFAEAADHLGPAVMALVEGLLGRELATDRPAVLDAVRRVVTATAAGAPLTLRLHPDDAALVTGGDIDVETIAQRPVTVLADPAVERGGAVADSGARHIDAQLSRALDRLRAELAP